MGPKNKTGGQKKSRATNSHKLPDPFPKGEILKDHGKKQWCLGDVIGQGGFGLIYTAKLVEAGNDQSYVVKIEPISNGPLFCELHVYQRIAKPEMIDEWTKAKKLKYLGLPKYISSGSHTRGKETFRFMVIERFGTDVQKIFEKVGKKFAKPTVCALALRLLDVLEYMHNRGYAHADIKASNLLTGYSHGKEQLNQVYLVDFGLAYKFFCDGVHKPYKEDPKRCHDGTVEFTSTDAHKGVAPSRRGDLEILGFCLLQWLCSRLPWENNLENKDYVRDSKIRYMKDIPGLMKVCFPSESHPDEISKYLNYVSKLKYDEVPDYNKLRSLFKSGLSGKDEWKMDLPTSTQKTQTGVKRKSMEPGTPVEKRARTTPKPKITKKTAKNTSNSITSPSHGKSTPLKKQGRSPLKSPVKSLSKSSPYKSPAMKSRQQISSPSAHRASPASSSRRATPKASVVAKKQSRSRTPVDSVETKEGKKNATKRKVKRRKAVPTSDASIQTSPGFPSSS